MGTQNSHVISLVADLECGLVDYLNSLKANEINVEPRILTVIVAELISKLQNVLRKIEHRDVNKPVEL